MGLKLFQARLIFQRNTLMQCLYCQFAIFLYTVIPVSVGTL